MLEPATLRDVFERGEPFARYVERARAHEKEAWVRSRSAAALTPGQRALLSGFTRRMNVLVSSGLWCGDCAAQVPLIDAIASATPPGVVDVRIVDRDRERAFAEAVRICGGLRVPTVVFMNEDFEFMGLMGDNTLSRLRAKAASSLGAACPLPGGDEGGEGAAMAVDWVAEFERVQLMLRLSPKLRDRHGE